jgi:hypothetical protein
MELQMEELKEAYAVEEEKKAPKTSEENNKKNAEIAKLYEDAAEYEEDLKGFEEELEVINANATKDLVNAFNEAFPDDARDFEVEFKNILDATWKHYVEVDKTHPQEQLDVIATSKFSKVVDNLNAAFPDYSGDFEAEVKSVFVTRYETLIAIKKEHIKEEIAEIKIMGLKPNYVQRIYKQFHGIK